MHRLRNIVGILHSACLLLAFAAAAMAQDYPAKPVRLIVPFTPGGSVDTVARIVATRLGERLGRQVVVDNRPGASGIIATEIAVNAPADGHTLLMMSFTHTMSPWLRKLPYDPRNSFVPVALLGKGISVLSAHPSLPVNSVKELIALAISDTRRSPCSLTCRPLPRPARRATRRRTGGASRCRLARRRR